jgi:hypothetical protein
MGVVVQRSSREEDGRLYSWNGWGFLFNLAVENGWEPQGTVLEPHEEVLWMCGEDVPEAVIEKWIGEYEDTVEWNGSYFINDGQWVTTEDARNMTNALTRALENIDYDQYIYQDLMKDHPVLHGKEALVKDFIEFCKLGGFRIY